MIMGDFQSTLYALFVKSWATSSRRLEASAALWEDHTDKPSTHVLTPPKLGAFREVARDNIVTRQRGGVSIKPPNKGPPLSTTLADKWPSLSRGVCGQPAFYSFCQKKPTINPLFWGGRPGGGGPQKIMN